MGIRHLNKFLRENSPTGIKVISLSELFGKKIAVDINIYMHKFASENNLIEGIYNMLSTFRHYNIIPIFVFDGKPPAEKKALLLKRHEDRKDAILEYDNLQNILKNNEMMNEPEKQDIISQMILLKRNFVQIKKNDIDLVKSLITAYGATYYDAHREADELCAYLAIKGKVWATLSEDMDMFVYGCPNTIRYLSLLNHNAVWYDMSSILKNLGITQRQLREICILSGTDYNSDNSPNAPNLYDTLKLFKKYFKETKNTNTNTNKEIAFYEWLIEKTDYIQDYDLLLKIYDMFDLSRNHNHLKPFENIRIANGSIMKEELHEILKTDGFFFP
jgi:flap endonuclease-1